MYIARHSGVESGYTMVCGRNRLCIDIASLPGVQAGSIAPLRSITLSILTLKTVSAILVYGYEVGWLDGV